MLTSWFRRTLGFPGLHLFDLRWCLGFCWDPLESPSGGRLELMFNFYPCILERLSVKVASSTTSSNDNDGFKRMYLGRLDDAPGLTLMQHTLSVDHRY